MMFEQRYHLPPPPFPTIKIEEKERKEDDMVQGGRIFKNTGKTEENKSKQKT